MSKKMCELCGKNPATVPDRERMGRLINRVCLECHQNRLKMDIRVGLARKNNRNEKNIN